MIPSVNELSDEIHRRRTNQFCWFACENKEEEDVKETRQKKVEEHQWKSKDFPKL